MFSWRAVHWLKDSVGYASHEFELINWLTCCILSVHCVYFPCIYYLISHTAAVINMTRIVVTLASFNTFSWASLTVGDGDTYCEKQEM